MRNLVQNIADDFFQILRYDKKDWYTYWEKYREKYEPIIHNYEEKFALSKEQVKELLDQLDRPLIDRLMQYWHEISRDQKLYCSKLVSHRHDLFHLEKEDFSIILTGLLGIKDWVIVNGNRESVILIDLLSLYRKGIIDRVAEVAFQSVKAFRDGEDTGEYISKQRLFSQLLKEIDEIVKDSDLDDSMQKICTLLYSNVAYYDWVGFYLVSPDKEDELVLGPFVGEPTEHVRIPFGRGICGQAAATGTTFLVQDVSRETNYLSCSPKVKSEIVVPIKLAGKIFGEIDIDSHILSPFDEDDDRFLNTICEKISQKMRSDKEWK
ncbi:MAG: GAF domain-containing protein [Pseudothermotoga sp.]